MVAETCAHIYLHCIGLGFTQPDLRIHSAWSCYTPAPWCHAGMNFRSQLPYLSHYRFTYTYNYVALASTHQSRHQPTTPNCIPAPPPRVCQLCLLHLPCPHEIQVWGANQNVSMNSIYKPTTTYMSFQKNSCRIHAIIPHTNKLQC